MDLTSTAPRTGWLERLEHRLAGPRPTLPGRGRFWELLATRLEPGLAAPRQMPGIESRAFEGRNGPYLVLHNRSARTYLRLTEDEAFVWERLDGRPVREILAEYLAARGRLTAGRLFELLERLREAAMLDQPAQGVLGALADRLEQPSLGRRAERLLVSVLFVEIPLPGAGQAIAALYRAGGWLLCTRPAVLALLLVGLAGLVVYVGGVTQGDFEIMSTHGSFVLGFFVFLLANTLASLSAELGRSLATVHFGRSVHSAGLRMLFASPTFYADTRDIALESRRARMIVAASGPLALLVTGGAAGLALALGPGEPLRDGLFKLALLSYGTALFYLNPLVDLDGYTLLTEWLEQPELRQRSLGAVRERLRRDARPEREEVSGLRYGRGLALFGVLAVVWGAYTALGGVYLIGYRLLAGLAELLAHPDPTVRTSAAVATSLLGAAGAVLVAAVLMRLLRRAYRWADQHALLARPSTLLTVALGCTVALGLAALYGPLEETDFRALVAPPLVLLTLYYAFRLAHDYAPSPGRWLFAALAVWATAQFVAEETAILRTLVPIGASLETPLGSAWPRQATSLAALADVALLVAFALWIAPAWDSRYRAADSLLLVGLAGYALHPLAGGPRVTALLSTTASGLLSAGTAIYWALRQRSEPPAAAQAGAAGEDTARLAGAFGAILAQLASDIRSHAGNEATRQVLERVNRLLERAGWTLRFAPGGLERAPSGALLEVAPIYRQAMVLLLGACAARLGRPLVERLLEQHRELLPWDRREVLDAWVLRDLGWWREQDSPVPSRVNVEPFLRRLPLFARLDEAGLRAIASALRSERVPAGRTVVRQGEPGQSFYLIRSGAAEVWQRDEDGPARQLARLGEGDAFGELALLYDQSRNATVRAVTPLELLVMDRPDFDRLVRERYAVVARIGGELERERLLAELPLLADLAPSELSRLASRLEPVSLPPGAAVVRQGESGDALYLVGEGRLRVAASVDGQERELARLGPGEYFGEMALLYDQPRSATVTTLEPTTLYRLRKADFDWLLSEAGAAERELERVSSRRRRVDFESAARAQFGP